MNTYANTKAHYDYESQHYNKFGKIVYLIIWVALVPFGFPILMALFLKIFGLLPSHLLPWPWELFKTGMWSGSCPVCGEEVNFFDKPTVKEVDSLSCKCGAHFCMLNGDSLVYKNRT